MKLVVNTPGTYICKRGDCFQLQKGEVKQDFSAKKVEQILITTHIALSTDTIELAVENNIDIVFLKNTGQPLGRVWHSKLGSVSTIRRKQLFLQDHPFGLALVKEWLLQKMKNQIEHLNKLTMNRRDSRKDILNTAIDRVKVQIKNVENIPSVKSVDDVRDSIQGYEGTASRAYFGALGEVILEKYKFNGRSKNPAKDPFNCMLNYGYGILYSTVEKSCILAGLDPYIGIMHTDNYNRKTLVFDLVEMYRGYMDEIIFKLFSTKKVKLEHFDEVENGFYLNQEGKKLLIGEYNVEMEKRIRYKGRNIELQNIIQFDCHNIANRILKEDL